MVILLASAILQIPILVQLLIGIGILFFGVGYIVSQLRRGSVTASIESMNLANSEIELLKTSNERLTEEMKALKQERYEENEKYQKELGRLNGIVEQLQRERDEFRRLVMLEKVPDALKRELDAFVNTINVHFDEKAQEILDIIKEAGSKEGVKS